MMSCLPKAFNLKERELGQTVPSSDQPIMFVVGSMSRTGGNSFTNYSPDVRLKN
ncbi:hypothetical protein PO124_11580 [Bacillus licheniformis]|nr:hypothetical protein [Bacillus licheniformis]